MSSLSKNSSFRGNPIFFTVLVLMKKPLNVPYLTWWFPVCGFTFFCAYYPSSFTFPPPFDSTLANDIDSLCLGAGPSVNLSFPAETLLIGNLSTYNGIFLTYPFVIGARSFFGNGEVIIFENNMFGFRYPEDSLSIAFFDELLLEVT